jgi:hypothetical protein
MKSSSHNRMLVIRFMRNMRTPEITAPPASYRLISLLVIDDSEFMNQEYGWFTYSLKDHYYANWHEDE